MPAYVIASVRSASPDGAEVLAEYRRRNTDAVANHGGRFLARGGAVERLEGDSAPLRVVVMEFGDMEAARGWYGSAEYEPLKALRQAASETDLLLVEGVAQRTRR